MAQKRTDRNQESGCFHKLEHYPHPPYRYRCQLCGKLLKIASGHYPPKADLAPGSDLAQFTK